MSNLSEFTAAVDTITEHDYAALVSLGVDLQTLHGSASVVGVVEATVNDTAGTWQPTPGGRKLFAVPCGERGPHNIGWRRIDDLCAFDLNAPARFWLRHDAVNILNAVAVDRSIHYGEPLAVHDTPLSWLQHGANGCVIVRWADPHISVWLLGVRKVLADSFAGKKRLVDAMRDRVPEKHIPEIRTREAIRHAA